MSASVVQGDPITPGCRDRRSTTTLPQRIGQACVAPAMFSAPATEVEVSTPPRSAADRVLRFSDHEHVECNDDECSHPAVNDNRMCECTD